MTTAETPIPALITDPIDMWFVRAMAAIAIRIKLSVCEHGKITFSPHAWTMQTKSLHFIGWTHMGILNANPVTMFHTPPKIKLAVRST
jgi:hypothetical protein